MSKIRPNFELFNSLNFHFNFVSINYFIEWTSLNLNRKCRTCGWTGWSLKPVSGHVAYFKSESMRVVSSLLQQGVMHGAQGGLVALRVDLDVLDPDVLPEAQAHHIQVVATIAEGTRQLHKHCQHITVGAFFHCDLVHLQMTQEFHVELFMMLPFLSPKSVGSSFTTPSVKVTAQTVLYLASSRRGCTHTRWRRNVPTFSTSDTWST